MTEMLKKEFSRTSFLKGGGAMIVGFSLVGAGLGAKAANAAEDPYASNGPYDLQQIDSWLAINADNTVTLKPGKVELGQGSLTGFLMIAADELDMNMKQMRFAPHDTNVTANQGATVGSQSIQNGGPQIRAAASAARSALLDLAATSLGVAKASLTVTDGVVSGGGKTVTYGDLLGGKLFNVRSAAAFSLASGAPGTKAIADYKLVGTHGVVQRVDIPDKVSGKFTYVHNIRVPGMLHGRVVRPRGQGAYGGGTAPKVLSVDASSIKHVKGAQVVQFGDFVGVVADHEYSAIQAAAQLKVAYADNPVISGSGNLFKQMRAHDSAGLAPARISVAQGNFDSAFASAATKLSQSYAYHYTGSMAIGPECAIADVTPSGTRVYSNTQDAYTTRGLVKAVLDKVTNTSYPANRIRVSYYEGSSVYGPAAPYNDPAQGAAIMSALVGKPVRLQFMRWDTHGWGNYGPSQLVDIRAGIDDKGNLTAFEYTGFQIPYYTTVPAQQQVKAGTGTGGDAAFATTQAPDTTISGSQYSVANRRVIGKSLPLQDNYFKVTFLRAPLAPQSAFAAEQAIDELAYAAKMDPVAFRMQNIATTTSATPDASLRWKNVLQGVVDLSKWQPKVAASKLSSANVVTGRGIAFGAFANTMAAAVADVEVNKQTGKITVKHAFVATDAGYVVYPDGIHSNEEGAAMQGISRALVEAVAFDKKGVTSLDWVSYPSLRFKDAPKIEVHALTRTKHPQTATSTVAASGSRSTGGGEPGLAPQAAAIANAFFDATGVRIREAPMTPARVRAVLKAAGK